MPAFRMSESPGLGAGISNSLQSIFGLMNPLSRSLQTKSGDVVRGLRIIDVTKTIFTNLRSESEN